MKLSALIVLLSIGFISAIPMTAQESHGYLFIAPGSSSGRSTLQAGGGFEALVYRRLVGVGAEAGYVAPTRNLDLGFGVVSPNVYFHVPIERSTNVDPYFTLGYSLLFRTGTQNAFNYGGGINWWFRPQTGLKLELRDHTYSGVHYWGVRFGINFR